MYSLSFFILKVPFAILAFVLITSQDGVTFSQPSRRLIEFNISHNLSYILSLNKSSNSISKTICFLDYDVNNINVFINYHILYRLQFGYSPQNLFTNNAGIEPTYKPHPQSINYQVLSTATDDQSVNLAPGLLALRHVRSTTIDQQ